MIDPIDIRLAQLDRDLTEWDALTSFAEEHDITIEEAERKVHRLRDEAIIEEHHAGDMWP